MLYEKCEECKRWSEGEKKFFYSRMVATNWKPPSGINQRMRQFRCSSCSAEVFQVLTTKQLERLGEVRSL